MARAEIQSLADLQLSSSKMHCKVRQLQSGDKRNYQRVCIYAVADGGMRLIILMLFTAWSKKVSTTKLSTIRIRKVCQLN